MDKENKARTSKRSRRTVVTDEQTSQEELVMQENLKTSTRKAKVKRQAHVYMSEDDEIDTNQNNEQLKEIVHERQPKGLETPRRSTRKSIRPIQDYKDIVLRSVTKKKTQQNDGQLSEVEEIQVKWTPSSVGRTSEKRPRKSKRALKARKRFNTIDLTDKDSDNPNEDDEESDVFVEQTSITKHKKSASKKSKQAKEELKAKRKTIIEITDTPPVSRSKSIDNNDIQSESDKSPEVVVRKSTNKKSNPVSKEETSVTKQKKSSSKKSEEAGEELDLKRKSVIEITDTPPISVSKKSLEVVVRKSANRKSNEVVEEHLSNTKLKKRDSKKSITEEDQLNLKRKSLIETTKTPPNSRSKSTDNTESDKSSEVVFRKSANRKSNEVVEEQLSNTKLKKRDSKKSITAEDELNVKRKSLIETTKTPPNSRSKSTDNTESDKSSEVVFRKSANRKSNEVVEEQLSNTKLKKRDSKKSITAEDELNVKRKSLIETTKTPPNSRSKSNDNTESDESSEVVFRKSATRKSKTAAQEYIRFEVEKLKAEEKSKSEVEDSDGQQNKVIVHKDSKKEEDKNQNEEFTSRKCQSKEEEQTHTEKITKVELEEEEDSPSLILDSDEEEDMQDHKSISSKHMMQGNVNTSRASFTGKSIHVEIEENDTQTKAPKSEDLVEEETVKVLSFGIEDNDESQYSENSNFGSYLNAQKINISDLGLAPLEEEMPSLVVMEESNDVPQLNATFEASETDPLKIEDDFEKPVMASSKIKIEDKDSTDTFEVKHKDTNKAENKQEVKEKPKRSVRIHPEQLGGETPKRSSKAFRVPTPHKNKIDLIEQSVAELKATIKVESSENEEEASEVEARLSTSLPLEHQIESETPRICLRRRTFSLSEVKAKRNVYFHSPANQTALIEDLDLALMEKHKKSLQKPKNDLNLKRRSKSLEDFSHNIKSSANQKQLSSLKKDKDSAKFRTKLPNFAALHERNFSKMENIEDFLQRKADRAKKLLNSASKLAPTSSAKKLEEKSATKRDVTGKPKALKKIDLASANNNNVNINKNVDETVKRIPRPVKKPKLPSVQIQPPEDPLKLEHLTNPINHSNRLPKPMDITKKTINLTVSEKIIESVPPKVAANIRKPEKKVLKPVNSSRPAFNLSTALTSTSSLNSTSTTSTLKTLSAAKGLNHTVDLGSANKNTSRLQRHMEMFKSRSGRKVGGNLNDTAQRVDLIRGVRSNRRFELQMQHRRNLES